MTETQPDAKDAQPDEAKPDEAKPDVVVTPPKAPPAPKPDPWDE